MIRREDAIDALAALERLRGGLGADALDKADVDRIRDVLVAVGVSATEAEADARDASDRGYSDVTIRVSGPAIWYVNREGQPPVVTIRRLDSRRGGDDPQIVPDNRERLLVAALLEAATANVVQAREPGQ